MLDSVECRIDLGLSQQVCCRAKKFYLPKRGILQAMAHWPPSESSSFYLGCTILLHWGKCVLDITVLLIACFSCSVPEYFIFLQVSASPSTCSSFLFSCCRESRYTGFRREPSGLRGEHSTLLWRSPDIHVGFRRALRVTPKISLLALIWVWGCSVSLELSS